MKNKLEKPSIGYLITKVGRYISRDYNLHLEKIDLTPLQAGILVNLYLHEEMAQAELMNAIIVDKATINAMLKSLRLSGFIEMVKNPNDLRVWQITLTSKGKKLIPTIMKIDEDVSSKYAKLFGRSANTVQNEFVKVYSELPLA
ncbi:MAG: MarR family transcriptional regulator [Bacteriovorax sp.]|nr:MarR family transcriptional regulator [Bacteriovorax sp.]